MAIAFTALGVGGISRKAGEEPQHSEGLWRSFAESDERMWTGKRDRASALLDCGDGDSLHRFGGGRRLTKSWGEPQHSEGLRRSRGEAFFDIRELWA